MGMHSDQHKSTSCDGDCGHCPAVGNHIDSHRMSDQPQGPYQGAGLAGRAAIFFLVPALLPIGAVLTVGWVAPAADEAIRFAAAVVGLATGIAIGIAYARREQHQRVRNCSHA
jgi:membrane associated rhomboid family serine protease